MQLWTKVVQAELEQGRQDLVTWSWSSNGEFTTNSAYNTKFRGRQVVPTAEFTWKAKAPLRCRFFTWTPIQDRCWTSDRLARRGLEHQDRCPLCDQEEETMGHITLRCVFAREVWTAVLQSMGKQEWIPATEQSMTNWCAEKGGASRQRRSQAGILTLVMWEIWKDQNVIIFDGASPSKNDVLLRICNEGRAWKEAGLLKGNTDEFFAAVERWARPEVAPT